MDKYCIRFIFKFKVQKELERAQAEERKLREELEKARKKEEERKRQVAISSVTYEGGNALYSKASNGIFGYR